MLRFLSCHQGSSSVSTYSATSIAAKKGRRRKREGEGVSNPGLKPIFGVKLSASEVLTGIRLQLTKGQPSNAGMAMTRSVGMVAGMTMFNRGGSDKEAAKAKPFPLLGDEDGNTRR